MIREEATGTNIGPDFAMDFFKDTAIKLTKQVQLLRMYELAVRK